SQASPSLPAAARPGRAAVRPAGTCRAGQQQLPAALPWSPAVLRRCMQAEQGSQVLAVVAKARRGGLGGFAGCLPPLVIPGVRYDLLQVGTPVALRRGQMHMAEQS